MSRFALADAPADTAALRQALLQPGNGGYCSFEGWVRQTNEGRAVRGLDYQAYTALALAEGERILAEACARFAIGDARAVHRVGSLAVGELAVWIGVAAPHRDAAFQACRYIIDEIKSRVPIWKREHYLDGDAAWVACSHPAGHAHAAPHG